MTLYDVINWLAVWATLIAYALCVLAVVALLFWAMGWGWRV